MSGPGAVGMFRELFRSPGAEASVPPLRAHTPAWQAARLVRTAARVDRGDVPMIT